LTNAGGSLAGKDSSEASSTSSQCAGGSRIPSGPAGRPVPAGLLRATAADLRKRPPAFFAVRRRPMGAHSPISIQNTNCAEKFTAFTTDGHACRDRRSHEVRMRARCFPHRRPDRML
jgi:hypothetical protein